MKMFSRKNRKGFTLIELIVVIAILAILAAIAIPSFIGITDNANMQVARANATNIATAYNTYVALGKTPALATDKSSYTAATLETAIGTNLWPKGLDSAEAAAAWPYVTITGGVADVSATAAAAPATSSGT